MTGTKNSGNRIPEIVIGDFVPKITLPDKTGKSVELTDQLIAGNTLVLWFLDEKPGKIDWQKIDPFLEETQSAEVLTFLIVCGRKSPKKAGSSNKKVTELYDEENAVRKLFGIAGPSIIVIDPNNRLAGIDTSSNVNQIINTCKFIHNDSEALAANHQAPVMVMKDVLEPELCAELLRYWDDGEKRADGVSLGSSSNSTAKKEIKKRNDVVLLDEALFNRVKARIVSRLAPELIKAFHFRTASMEALRIGCYDAAEEGHFARHRDNRTTFTAHRRFAVSLNLNAIDYEGGQVRFPEYGRTLYAPPPGGALVFSCSLLHEAVPVTKGKRFAIFTFLTDEAGALAERKMMAERNKQLTPFSMKS